MAVKYVFVTGGVVSGLGKGITAASLGRLLKSRGYFVTMQKFDPYLNIDPGTMNPYQHGEVFVTDDGTKQTWISDIMNVLSIVPSTAVPTSQAVKFTGMFSPVNDAAITVAAQFRLSLISPMPSRAVSTEIHLQEKLKLQLLKLAALSAISKASHSWSLSVSSSMKSAAKTAC